MPQLHYPAGALAAALFIVSGIRGMERGTISMDRDADGNDVPSEVELLRLAMPRRVFTLSQVKYVEDRVKWLYQNRELVGGLEFYDEPKVLRFFVGRLRPTSDWTQHLLAKFRQDFPRPLKVLGPSPRCDRRKRLGYRQANAVRLHFVRHGRLLVDR